MTYSSSDGRDSRLPDDKLQNEGLQRAVRIDGRALPGNTSQSDSCIRVVDAAEFPVTRHCHFLDHASLAPLPKCGADAVKRWADDLGTRGPDWSSALMFAEDVRREVADYVGAQLGEIGFVRSTTYGISVLASGLDWTAGDNVVTVNGEYPSNVYPWQNQRHRGVEIRLAPSFSADDGPQKLLDLVDRRTRVVTVSAVQFWNGFRHDLETIGTECRQRGIIFAVDGIQAVGCLATDLRSLPVDFLACGATKWLMCPLSTGFLYSQPELIERIRPPIVGTDSVIARTEYFDYDFRLSPSARRFEESSPNVLGLAALQANISLLASYGQEAIERRVVQLAQRLRAALNTVDCRLVAPQAEQRSGIVSFAPVRSRASDVFKRLQDTGFRLSLRGDFLRASPHFYNTEADVDALLDALDGC